MQQIPRATESTKAAATKGLFFLVLALVGLFFLNKTLPTRNIRAQQAVPMLFTTLDSAAAVSAPVNGDSTGSAVLTNPANDFVPARTGSGIRIDANNEYVRYQQIAGTTQNVEYDKGTVTFWYQPNYANTDGIAHRLWGIGNVSSAGFIGLVKRSSANGNDLAINIRDAANTQFTTSVPATNYSWVAGQWVNIRVTWDTTAASGVQNVHIYIDGNEPGYSATTAVPIAMPAESATQYVSIGTFMLASGNPTLNASGIFDDFAVYGSVEPPPITDTVVPTVTVTSPTSGQVLSGNVLFQASANDNIAVAGVQFIIDGANYGAEDTVAPYELTVNTTLLNNSSHTVDALARDTSNNTATSSVVNFSVSNQTSGNKPNVIVLLADDMRYDSFKKFMPLTYNWLTSSGVNFDKAFVADSLCCPSRTTILTSQYAHNTGIFQNKAPYGGATMFQDSSTLATWMQNSGYRTGLFGKYLNDYNQIPTYIPPGWSDWHAFSDSGAGGLGGFYYGYTLNDNGTNTTYGSAASDYALNQLYNRVDSFINSTPSNQPFMIYFAGSNPHGPSTPDPRDTTAFPNLPNWRPPSFNEADVSDKPTWVKNLPLMTATEIAQYDSTHKLQAQSLKSLDRIYDQIRQSLVASGRINNTYIIFTSDNGLEIGEHRWNNRKTCAYEECIHVPFVVAPPPGVLTGYTDNTHLVQNIDIAPTIASISGISLQGIKILGLNIMDIINNSQAPWRSEVLIEQQHEFYPERDFNAIRDSNNIYVEYNNGDREFYNVTKDPYQLANDYNNPANATIIANLKAKLANLLAQ